jgi:hypothetical protein
LLHIAHVLYAACLRSALAAEQLGITPALSGLFDNTMKAFGSLGSLSLIALTHFLSSSSQVQAQNAPAQWPLHDNGLNDVVQWDHYSFKVNGKRLFIFSGELHYWRIPVPEVWEDILEKIKAAGFTVSALFGVSATS